MTSAPWLVVLAGGAGTRFWPRSRARLPKQLLNLVGDDTLLNITIKRFQGWISPENVLIVTTAALEAPIRNTLGELRKVNILCEPFSKNTAPCLVMAMEWIRARDPSATAIVVPADHWITEIPEYLKVMKLAVKVANTTPNLCTVGIQPTRPETGYGYIRAGESFADKESASALKDATRSVGIVYAVDRFVEKPKREVAETMVQHPEYFWNAGMFVWTMENFFKELQGASPDLVESFKGYHAALKAGSGEQAALEKSYASANAISIDYALLERSKHVAVVPGTSFTWNDLGSFVALDEILPPTEGGVANAKQVISIDSVANIIDCPGKIVALVGVTNMILVDAGDVLLLTAKERSQDVKKIVERLKKEKREELL